MTLEILRALTAECRRDLALFSSGVLASIDIALVCLPKDLEVVARAASTASPPILDLAGQEGDKLIDFSATLQFTAWATYTDGTLLGVDESLTQTYLSVLRMFSKMGITDVEKKADEEFRSR